MIDFVSYRLTRNQHKYRLLLLFGLRWKNTRQCYMTPSIRDVCTKKLVIPKFTKEVNLLIKLFFADQMSILFFLLLRFFSRKIEVWIEFIISKFFYKKYVNFINEWRWPKNYRCGICFKIIKYWKYEKSLYFDHVKTKKNFPFFHIPPRSFRRIHPLFL
jgi:hypothetical protein